MPSDEQQIRDVIATWMAASKAGDAEALRPLMDEDIVFLLPGQPPMRGRDAFLAAFQPMVGKVEIDGHSEIQEIQVADDWAYVWNYLNVSIRAPGGPVNTRAGNVLSIFRKQPDGRWTIYRDANLLGMAKATTVGG